MDADHLEFDDGQFDAAICALGLMYVPEPVVSLKEMARVLKIGSRATAARMGATERIVDGRTFFL